jgi:hypothetical protein
MYVYWLIKKQGIHDLTYPSTIFLKPYKLLAFNLNDFIVTHSSFIIAFTEKRRRKVFNTIHDIHEWVSEWLLFNALKSNCSTISWQEQVTFQWDDYVLYKSKKLSWIFIVLAHWKKQSVWKSVVPVGYIALIPSQPVLSSFVIYWLILKHYTHYKQLWYCLI